jgi:hypothetical protein
MSAQLRRALITLGTLLLCLSPVSVRAQREPERSAAELMDVLMWNREPRGERAGARGHIKIAEERDAVVGGVGDAGRVSIGGAAIPYVSIR